MAKALTQPSACPQKRARKWLIRFAYSLTDRGGAHIIIDKVYEFCKIIRKHVDQFLGLLIIGLLIGSNVARIQQAAVNALRQHRHFKTKI